MKAFTEALQRELRNTPDCQVSAHLLIPGFVWTELTAGAAPRSRPRLDTRANGRVHAGASRVGDFYILCPDNEVPRSLDERRILRAAGDIVENRPGLERAATVTVRSGTAGVREADPSSY